jgi:hypothetical protein
LKRWLPADSWVRQLCRRLATPIPLTYADLRAVTSTHAVYSRGSVYKVLGLLDCGDPEMFLGLVKRASQSPADDARMRQLVSALMADYVFALKFDELVFNPYSGGDAGALTPIVFIMQEFGKDVPAPVAVHDLTGAWPSWGDGSWQDSPSHLLRSEEMETQFLSGESSPVRAGTSGTRPHMKCPRCGYTNPPTAESCACGFRFARQPEASPTARDRGSLEAPSVTTQVRKPLLVRFAAGLGLVQGLMNLVLGILGILNPNAADGIMGIQIGDLASAMALQGGLMTFFAVAIVRGKLWGAYGLLAVSLLYIADSLYANGSPWIIPALLNLGAVIALHRAKFRVPPSLSQQDSREKGETPCRA